MQLGRYRLLAQLGAGADGASYRAADDAGEPAEVRVLTGAFAAPDRLKDVARRLRMAAMLHHPAAIRVRELGLEQTPPFAALEWVEGKSLAECFVESPAGAGGRPADRPRSLRGPGGGASPRPGARPAAPLADSPHRRRRPETRLQRSAKRAIRRRRRRWRNWRRRAAPGAGRRRPGRRRRRPVRLGAVLYWLVRGRPRLPGQTPHAVVRNLE